MTQEHTSAGRAASRRPRTKPAEVRLEELMGAAERLFLEKGVEATTISEIVEAADVAKGTFYHYFSSKNDMLEALGKRYTTQFMERLQVAVDACAANDWPGRLRAWIRANIDTYVETYRVHDIVYVNHHHHDRANAARNAILDQLREILERGESTGVWQLAHPHVTALLIYAGVHGATDDIIVAKPSDYSMLAQAVIDNCLRMVGLGGEAAG
ncbi:AcrR family transcriptional regulator [Pseudomonas aeruginosa]|uniref:TetR/AcrR family transcriptional regulator n=1 Tax=Pseudomonas aeruginosa TaxID=287 RepID=UPI00053E221C|nr:TetR/AcrR family transcriptional regulator [Pseudomonas aeruginosa]EIU7138620.1 TetR/AcrR family transcriptional regulator [Pseudomonas aeruginosa]ELX8262534.1 TetR/AcrR family transcriptional regulator [Pseudomonas aeruginosa]KSL23461.1 TetR family transcriptional regulator [Pseudomonas aeruginosa]MBG4362188.1 TetR/AcrR family transcriptional regulator [Pseudomonas aeruginosa]MBG6303428.1 TetR/AcrR family transcriptional regulator [Pseudomonas aeruginosa]